MKATRLIIILAVGAILLLTASIGLANANPAHDTINVRDIQFPALLVITRDMNSFTSVPNLHDPATMVESLPPQAP